MKDITIFTKPDCPKCVKLKGYLSEAPEDFTINYIDTSSPDGMALASYHEVLKENFPVMIHDGFTIAGEALKIKQYILKPGGPDCE